MEIFDRFLNNLNKSKFVLLFTILFTFFAGYFIGESINYVNATYDCNFTSIVEVVQEDILNIEHLTKIRDSADKYKEINTEKLIKNKEIYLVKNSNTYTITTYSRCYETFFIKSSSTVSTRAKMFIKDLLLDKYGEDAITFELPNDIIKANNRVSQYTIGLLTSSAFCILSIAFMFFKPIEEKESNIYDNEKVFANPFHLQYWKNCLNFVSTPKKIASLAMLFALYLLSKAIVLPSGFGNLGLSFGFIFFSISCLTYGPVAALVIGFFGDIIGYFLFDTTGYPFAFCYVLQTMLAGFIYGIMLNQTKISYIKVFTTRLLIGFLCNVIVGSLCWGSINNYTLDQTLSYMLLFELPKNIVYLLPQSIVLFTIYKLTLPILGRSNLIDKKITDNITLL